MGLPSSQFPLLFGVLYLAIFEKKRQITENIRYVTFKNYL
jgi:hypothetical protein